MPSCGKYSTYPVEHPLRTAIYKTSILLKAILPLGKTMCQRHVRFDNCNSYSQWETGPNSRVDASVVTNFNGQSDRRETDGQLDPYIQWCLRQAKQPVCYLTLKTPNKNLQKTTLIFFYFHLNKKLKLDVSWESLERIHIFMWIFCLTEDSHELSSLIFSEKQWKSVYAVVTGTFSIKAWRAVNQPQSRYL